MRILLSSCHHCHIKRKKNAIAIGALNFFLGWTLLGWVVSLVWSLTSESKNQRVIISQRSPGKNDDLDKLSQLPRGIPIPIGTRGMRQKP
ncbi:superinfection immunity protein [Sinomicrobium sp. M5D2P17]